MLKDQGHNAQVFSKEKKGLRAESRKFFVKLLRPWPVFNKSKNSAILGREQGTVFSRSRT